MSHRFSYFKLAPERRLWIAFVLYATAVIAQMLVYSPWVGLFFILPAWIFLKTRELTGRPNDQGLEEWRAVSPAEVNRVVELLAKSKRKLILWGFKLAFKIAFAFVVFMIFLGLVQVSILTGIVIFDLLFFTFPWLFFGMVKPYVPIEFKVKMKSFQSIMDMDRSEDFVLTPYLRFDKDDKGLDIPEDIRMMLEPRRKPDDLVGVQIQASINKGPKGQVPYMYAVVLARGTQGLCYRYFRALDLQGFCVESSRDGQHGIVVIRQETSGTGYHTEPEDCQRLMELVMGHLGRINA